MKTRLLKKFSRKASKQIILNFITYRHGLIVDVDYDYSDESYAGIKRITSREDLWRRVRQIYWRKVCAEYLKRYAKYSIKNKNRKK